MTSAEYDRVKDLMSLQEFEAKVKDKVAEWAGLVDDKAASLIVLDELGRLQVPFNKISELEDATEVSVRGRVESIGPVREFARKSGEQGRVVNVELDDGSGRCRLTLWDDDVKMIERGYIKTGKTLRALDCYARKSNFGLEIGRGKFGSVIAEE